MQHVATFSEEAEESILGAMMSSPRAVIAALDRGLRAHHFYKASRGLIFDAILQLDNEGAKADSVTVARVLRESGSLEAAGGVAELSTLVQMCPAVSNAGHYAQIVLDHATERGIQQAAAQLQELVAGEGSAADKIAEAERIIAEATYRQGGDYQQIGATMGEAFRAVEEAYTTGVERVGLKTGFIEFDRITNGLKAGQMVTIAARPGMGKSLLGQNVAEYVAGKGKSVCIFSLEMASDEIGLRMLASQSRVDHDKIIRGQMAADEWQRVKDAQKRIGELPIYVVDGTPNVTELRARARRLQRSEGLDLLIVDYLQLLSAGRGHKGDSRENEVSRISRGLKLLAGELRIPVIAMAQLNRSVESRTNKRPMLSDLRESGSIEQDSDIVTFLYRDEYYDPDSEEKGIVEAIVAKQRAGKQGTVKLRALLETCRFSNLAREQGPMKPQPPTQGEVSEPAEPVLTDIPF